MPYYDEGESSSSESTTPKEERGKATRFNYLLKPTEIFAHFMNTTRSKKQPTSPLKMKAPKFPSRSRKLSDCGENFVQQFMDFPKPQIAAVNGPAEGISITIMGLFGLIYEFFFFFSPMKCCFLDAN